MKTIIYKYTLVVILLSIGISSCNKNQFAKDNTNPDALLTIDPKSVLSGGLLQMNNQDFEVFYDFNRNIRLWTQQWVAFSGNTLSGFQTAANTNVRWGNFYGSVGPRFKDVMHIIDEMPAAKKATYAYMRAMAGIPYAYYAFYTSDPNGSMPYTQAFEARYTIPPMLTPVYDTQDALFTELDAELKSIVTTLSTPQPVQQVMLGTNDLYYPKSTDYSPWIKAANSLRLRIAMRLMKRNPGKLTAIANELLSDPSKNLISSIADEMVFYGGPNFAGGNDNPGATISGEKHTVDFMWKTQDPRMRNFYQPSPLSSKDLFDAAQASGAIPSGATWDGQLYRGEYANPTDASNPALNYYFSTLTFNYNGAPQSFNIPSAIQQRMIYAPYNGGSGLNAYPAITYADVCFMRAELAVRGLSNDPTDPKILYENGVTASITDYDTWASQAQVVGYTPLGSSEISAYLAQPGVAYDPANAKEQIIVQAYLNFYLQPNEAWALLKRTDYPSPFGSIMPLANFPGGNYPITDMPRRYVITFPSLSDLNYKNATQAITDMEKDPGFGLPSDITGRIWWDQK